MLRHDNDFYGKLSADSIRLHLLVLFRMARPPQILLIGFVYLFGAVVGWATGQANDAESFWLGLLILIPGSMSVHYANEYADYETDLRTKRTLYSGGSGALPESGLPRRLALIAAWVSLFVVVGLAFLGLWARMLHPMGMTVLFVGVFFGWMYSLPPFALAWRGWGEITNALLGAMLLPQYGYAVQAGRLDLRLALVYLPFVALAFNNLLATTWADRRADAAVGKYTMATRWSPRNLQKLYTAVALGAFLSLLAIRSWLLPPVVFWFSLFAFPAVLWGALTYTQKRNPLPSVSAMVLMLTFQLIAWGFTALKFPL
ncbi:MAG: prenyltransferase [Anaerolineales bacterium]|nr:prenyltransferase [Anaerolineales bacterium]